MFDHAKLFPLVCTALAAGWISFLVVAAINAFQEEEVSSDDDDRLSGDW